MSARTLDNVHFREAPLALGHYLVRNACMPLGTYLILSIQFPHHVHHPLVRFIELVSGCRAQCLQSCVFVSPEQPRVAERVGEADDMRESTCQINGHVAALIELFENNTRVMEI